MPLPLFARRLARAATALLALAGATPALAGYADSVLASQPLAYWRFEETGGTVAHDATGAHDGTYHNVTLGAGSAFAGLGRAAAFDGSSAYVAVPAIGSAGDVTIEAWVRADSFPQSNWAALYNTELFLADSSHWQFVNTVYGADTRFEWALGFSDMSNLTTFDTGRWYHIVTTYLQSTGEANLYVNGELRETLYTLPGKTTTFTAGNIGAWLPQAGAPFYTRFFHGRIDELAVYPRRLTASEVAGHYGSAGTIAVAIDIKPEGMPNSINPRSQGVIPVAILMQRSVDATIDPATVRFGRAGTEAAPVHHAYEDVDGDGDADLLLHFATPATGIACGDTLARLTGQTYGGQAIAGSDSVRTTGCH